MTTTTGAAFVTTTTKIPRGGGASGAGVFGTDITKKNLAALWTGVAVASSIVAIPAPEKIGQAYGIVDAKPDTQPYYFLESMATKVSKSLSLSLSLCVCVCVCARA